MKQIFLKSFCARCLTLLILALLSTNLAWGEEVTYEQTSASAASVSSGTAPTGSSVTFSNTYTSNKQQLTKGNSMTYTLKGYAGYKITSLKMSMKSNSSSGAGKFSLKAGSVTLAEIREDTDFNNAAWNGSWSSVYVDVTPTMSNDNYVIQSDEDVVLTISASENSLYCQSITLTYVDGNATSISADNVELEADATSGEIGYEINNPVGENFLTASSDNDWISDIQVTTEKVAFTTTANTAFDSREGTISLKYGDGIATKDVKVTQAAITFTSIEDLFENMPESGKKDVTIKMTNWIVSGVKGDNAYITDNAGKGLIVYKSGHGFEVGDILSGTVKCALTKYNGSAEITNLTSTTEGLTVTKNGTVNPVDATISELSGVNTGAYINLGELTYNGTEFTDGTNTIKPYNTFITLPNLTEGIKYNVKGVYIQFNNTKEIAPTKAEDFEKVAATEYNITVTPCENGSVTVDAGNNKAQAGQVIKLTVSPNNGYKLATLTVKDATESDVIVTDNKFTMPASNVTISATFVAKAVYNITWMVNGEQYEEISNVTEGETLTLPVAPTPPAGYAFVGWVANEITTPTNTEPTFLADGTKPTANATYYAAFAKAEEESEIKEFTFTVGVSDFNTTSYNANNGSHNFTAKCTTDNTKQMTVACTTNQIMQSSNVMQWQKNAGYIYNTTDLGTIKSVVVNSTEGTFTTYYGTSEHPTSGTTVGNGFFTVQVGNATGKTSSVVVTFEKEVQVTTYSNYCTKLASANMVITSAEWGTFCAPFDAAIPEGVKAYTAAASGSEVAFTEVETTIPAGTPVVVYSATEVDETLGGIATKTGETCTEGALVGVYTAKSGIAAEAGHTNYVLQNNSNGVGFYKATSAISLKANRCYMTLATSAGAKDCIGLDGAVTGINEILNPTKKSVEGIYDLNGRKLAAPQKGINIINGVKVIVK